MHFFLDSAIQDSLYHPLLSKRYGVMSKKVVTVELSVVI